MLSVGGLCDAKRHEYTLPGEIGGGRAGKMLIFRAMAIFL
jgi:hypothetical protein